MNSKKVLGGMSHLYQRIIALFPRDISLSFAYGSAVYPQKQEKLKEFQNNVIDLVFVVPNAFLWHEENIKINPKHYSSLRYLGYRNVTRIQETYGAGVYYNTLIPFENITFKYGVISDSSLISDLLDWNYLYLAGRLHKPVLKLHLSPENVKLKNALESNLHSAMHAALLMLPEAFTEIELYRTIAGLSYNGDFRMIFGEDKNKIDNIVDNQLNLFRELYSPVVKSLKDYMEMTDIDGKMIGAQDPSPLAKMYHLNQLPRTPQRIIVQHWNRSSKRKLDTEDILASVAHDVDTDFAVDRVLRDIVWSSSVRQSIKGIFTAGILKSVRYSMAKIKKMMYSKATNKDTLPP